MNKANLSAQKFLMVFVVGLFLISFVSAEVFTFDNKVDYVDDSLLKVDIVNTFGLGATLGTIELKSHKTIDEIIKVGYGDYNPVMVYEFSNWELYENGLGNVYFKNMKNGKDTDKLYYFAEWKKKTREIPIYSSIETLNKNGTTTYINKIIEYETQDYYDWVRYDSKDIPNTKTEIRKIALMVYTEKGEYTDAIWTLAGKRIKEHASWTADLNNDLLSYWKLDEASGSVIDSLGQHNGTNTGGIAGQSGLINTAYSFASASYVDFGLITAFDFNAPQTDFTIALWLYPLTTGTNEFFMGNAQTDSVGPYIFNRLATGKFHYYFASPTTWTVDTDSGLNIPQDQWNFIVIRRDGSIFTPYVNGVMGTNTTSSGNLISGATTRTFQFGKGFGSSGSSGINGSIDEVGIWNRSLTYAEITDLYNGGSGISYTGVFGYTPRVTLNSPVDNYNSSLSEITFNTSVNVYDTKFRIDNVSLLLNGTINQTNTSHINGTYIFTKTLENGEYNWSIIAYSNSSTINQSETRNINVSLISPTINIYSPENNLITSTATHDFIGDATDNGEINNVSYYYDDTLDQTNSSGLKDVNYTFSKTLTEGEHTWYFMAFDNDSNPTDSSTWNIELDTISPVITGTNLTNFSTQTFPTTTYWNYNASDKNIDLCYYNTSQNTTYVVVTCNSTIGTQIVNDADKDFYYCANDTSGFETCKHTALSIFYYTAEPFQSLDIVSEGSDIVFTLFVNATNLPETSAYLTYNNTNYSFPVKQEFSDYTKFTQTVTIPKGWGTVVGVNQSALWYYLITGYGNQNTSILYNTVYSLEVDDCSIYTHKIYNFTVIDEQAQTFIIANSSRSQPFVDIDLDFYRFATSTELQSFSQRFNGTNSITVCSNLPITGSLQYSVDGTISYSVLHSPQDNKVQEFYNIQNFTLSNTTAPQEINLSDLDNDSSTEFDIVYKDDNLVPVASAIIQIQRFYISEGIYKVVEIPITDSNGHTIAHLETGDVIYSFYVYQNGKLLAIFSDQLAKCESTVLDDCVINLNAQSSSESMDPFVTDGDFTFSLAFNETTRTATSVWNVPSGGSATVVLNASVLGSIVCTDTDTLSSSTLICIVPYSSQNQSVVIRLWRDNLLMGSGVVDLYPTSKDTYGGSRVFLMIILFLTIFGLAISDNPMVTGVTFVVGVVVALALNLVDAGSGQRFIGAGATFLWFVIAMAVVLIKAGRRN